MKNRSLKIFCIFLSCVFIMGMMIIPSLADESETTVTEETSEGLTEPVDKDYNYHSIIEDIFLNISDGTHRNCSLSDSNTSVDAPLNLYYPNLCSESVSSLALRGLIFTDFGVEKFKVIVDRISTDLVLKEALYTIVKNSK